MDSDATTLLAQLTTLVTAKREQGVLLMEQFAKLIPKDEGAEVETSTDEDLAAALTKMKLSQITKLRKYNKGESFARFTERFKEYTYITGMKDKKLYLFLLQNVDDATYSILKGVDLDDDQKEDPELFCDEYIKAIYGDQSVPLKSEVMDCKQQSEEDITSYAFRLTEKANIAFNDKELMDETCFLTFIRGVKDTNIYRKLNEGNVTSFEEALKLAKRLEKVENMLQEKPLEVSSILKETTDSFRPSRSSERFSRHERSTRSHSRERDRSESPRDFRRQSRDRNSWGDQRRSRSYSHDSNWSNGRFRSSSRDRNNSNWSNGRYRSSSRDQNGSRFRNRSFSRERYPFPPRNRYRQHEITCYFCKKRGHIKRNCRKFLRSQSRGGRPNTSTYQQSFQSERHGSAPQPVRSINRGDITENSTVQSDFMINQQDLN